MTSWSSLKSLPRPLFVLAAATFVNRIGSWVMPFLVLYLTRSQGVAAETAGGMLATFGAVSLVATPLGGRLCDRFGARRVVIGSLVLSGVVLLLYPLARTVPALFIVTALLSLVVSAYRPASMTLFGQLAPAGERKVAFALQRLAVHLAWSVGPALGGLLASYWFAGIFVVDGVTSLLSAGLLVAFMPVAIAEATESNPTGKPSDQEGPDDEAPAALDGRERRAHQDPGFLRFCVGLLCMALVFFQMDAALPLFMTRDLDLGERMFGLLFTINTVIIIFVEVPLNAWTARWPYRRSLVMGGLITALGFAATGLATGFAGIAVCVVVWTFGEMILLPSGAAYVSDIAPEKRSGEYMGFYSMAFAVAFTVAPWAGVVILDRLGSDMLWLCVLGVGLFSTLLLATVPQPERE